MTLFYDMKMTWNSNFGVHKVSLGYSHAHSLVYDSTQQQQTRVAATETLSYAKPKYLLFGLLREKFADP